MTPSFTDLGDRFVFANDDGTWTVWKQCSTDTSGNIIGPGYIGRAVMRNATGTRISEGFVAPGTTVNDPRIGGLGIVGWHHYRQIPGETSIWNKGWNFGGHAKAGADPFGVSNCTVLVAPYLDTSGNVRASFRVDFVDRYSAAEGKRVMAVRYDYIVEPSDVKMWVTWTAFPDGFDSGPQPFLKEPKIACTVGPANADGYRPSTLDIFRSDSTSLASLNLLTDPKLQNPVAGTEQLGYDTRCRARFYDGSLYFNVVARASDTPTYDATTQRPSDYKAASRGDWEGSAYGLDRWAQNVNPRVEFDATVCAAYCKQGPGGTVTRQWEVAKRGTEPNAEIMLHAWEGGSGMPDCLCCAKAFVAGETYTNYLSFSWDTGWAL